MQCWVIPVIQLHLTHTSDATNVSRDFIYPWLRKITSQLFCLFRSAGFDPNFVFQGITNATTTTETPKVWHVNHFCKCSQPGNFGRSTVTLKVRWPSPCTQRLAAAYFPIDFLPIFCFISVLIFHDFFSSTFRHLLLFSRFWSDSSIADAYLKRRRGMVYHSFLSLGFFLAWRISHFALFAVYSVFGKLTKHKNASMTF